jgi:hypothetical protein
MPVLQLSCPVEPFKSARLVITQYVVPPCASNPGCCANPPSHVYDVNIKPDGQHEVGTGMDMAITTLT